MYLLDSSPVISFDLTTVIISVLGSSVAATVVSYFTTLKIETRKFSFEHKKYIIKRRLQAYETIESYVTEIYNGIRISKVAFSENDKHYTIKKFFNWTDQIKNPFTQFYYDFYNQAIKDWYWFTPEFRQKMNAIFALFEKIRDEFETTEMQKKDLYTSGKKYDKELNGLGIQLAKQMIKDLPNMHIMQDLTK